MKWMKIHINNKSKSNLFREQTKSTKNVNVRKYNWLKFYNRWIREQLSWKRNSFWFAHLLFWAGSARGLRGGQNCRLKFEGYQFKYLLSLEFACSPNVCMGLLSMGLPQSKNMHVRLISGSKVTVCVCVCVCMRVCVCVCVWWTGDLSRAYPASCPMAAGIASSPLWPLNKIKQV